MTLPHPEEAQPPPDPGAVTRDPLLDVRGLARRFRGLEALAAYGLQLPAGTIHGVIGPNGAGKTTLFNVLSGFLRPTRGTVAFKGADITGSPAYKVSRLGIARTFQNIRLFGDLPVIDNVKVGLHRQVRPSLLRTLLTTNSFRATEAELTERSIELLELFGVDQHRDRLARSGRQSKGRVGAGTITS